MAFPVLNEEKEREHFLEERFKSIEEYIGII